MAMATADILITKQRRLAKLEQQAAALGYDTPPHVKNEIEDLQREIAASTPTTVAESHVALATLVGELRTDVRRLYWLIPVLLLIVILAVKL